MRQNYLWSFTKTKPWLPYIIPVQTHKTRPKIRQLFCRKGYFHTKEVWVYVCVQYACILGEFHCWPQWTMMMYQNNYPGKEQLLQGQANIWLDHTWPASVRVLTMLSISKAQETRSLYLLLFPILLPFLLLFLYFSYTPPCSAPTHPSPTPPHPRPTRLCPPPTRPRAPSPSLPLLFVFDTFLCCFSQAGSRRPSLSHSSSCSMYWFSSSGAPKWFGLAYCAI